MNMSPFYRPGLYVILMLLGLPIISRADDIDLFMAQPPGSSAPNPNVLLVLDNSANWSATLAGTTKFSAEMTALNSVLAGLDGTVNLGLELFGETGSGNSNPVTAYIRYAVRQMNATNKTALQSLFKSLNINNDKGSNAPYGFGLFEAFKYFGGGDGNPQNSTNFGPTAFGGFGQKKRDYSANANNTIAGTLAGNAFASSTSAQYVSPITSAGGCAQNYVIYISNGLPQSGGDSGNPNASSLLQNVGGAAAVTTIPLSNTVAQGNLGDEYARFLFNADVSPLTGTQNIVTYTIFVYDPSHLTGNDSANLVLLNSMANQGHGKFFAASDVASLVSALQTILHEIQAVNDVFAAVSLPVNVNVRGTSLNQVYMGVFRPDSDAQPKWLGNLKEYQLINSGGTNFLGDANGVRADNPASGFIASSAVSFWTSPSSYWSFRPSGTPVSGSDSPDGAIVEKGAAAEQLRITYASSQTARHLYTCTTCSSSLLSSTPFDTATLNPSNASVQASFGVSNAGYSNSNTSNTGVAGEVKDIINWVRGADNATDENSNGSYSDIRASVHGDVVHSRPAVINYNRTGSCSAPDSDDTFVFYGANDGIFHAIKGGQNQSDGVEQWGFVMPEFYGKLKRLRDNAPAITFNNLPPADTSNNKPYFADGSVAVYQLDADKDCRITAGTKDKVYLFISMRRGGRFIYAIDVTDPTTPKVMWKITPSTSGFADLGFTWSTPTLGMVKLNGTATPVLFFGGGYDPNVEDLDPNYITSTTVDTVHTSAGGGVTETRTMGRGLFAVKIADGSLVWTAGPTSGPSGVPSTVVSAMKFSLPSDPTVIDTNLDGVDDRIYIGDTGGNVWRMDISDQSPSHWNVVQLASVDSSTTSRRKFLFPPTVVAGSDSQGRYDAVLIGAGDREHPFDTSVTNRFYMLKDRATGLLSSQTTPKTEADLFDATNTIPVDPNDGFYITLARGEKVVSSSTALAGTVFFNSNIPPAPPSPGTCGSNLGTASLYAIDYETGAPKVFINYGLLGAPLTRTTIYPGGGFPPSPVPALVNVNGHVQQLVITGTNVTTVPGLPLGARTRTFWQQLIDAP